MSLQFTMSIPLAVEAGCKACEQIVLLFVFIVQQATNLLMFTSTYDSRRFVHANVERRYLGR